MPSHFSVAHAFKAACALAISFAFIGTGDAVARVKRTRAPITPPVADVVLPQTPSRARFFTINEVLAKRDGREPNSPFVKLAATERKSTQTDTPNLYMRPIASREPFELMTFRAPPGLLWQKWRKLEADLLIEDKIIERCRAEPKTCAMPGARRFIAIVDEARARTGRAKIDVVNRAINDAVSYASDMAQHGVPDLWSAPLATLSTKRGDCEDYAIAKFVVLQQAGVSQADLRLLLVRDRAVRQDHAVLAVRHNDHWLLLDNRYSILLDEKDAGQFTPLFALDHGGVKLFASPYARLLEGEPIDAMPAAWPRGDEPELRTDRGAVVISRGPTLPLVL